MKASLILSRIKGKIELMKGEKNCRPKEGFTLLELMVAMAIFVSVVTGLFVTFTACVFLNRSNSNLIIAANDAQYLLEEVKGFSYSDVTSAYLSSNYDCSSPEEFCNLDNSNNENFTFSVTGSDIKEVIVIVSWTERQGARSFTLSTRIAQ